jgi:methionyl-tRNA synthetase
VFGHGFMTVGGERMSKSNPGTIIDPIDAANRHGVDPLRLYLVKEISFGGDGDFSWERYDERYNTDLANNLGNLVSRVTAMAHQYRGGRLRSTGGSSAKLREFAADVAVAYRQSMEALAIHEAAASVFRLIDAANLHIADTAPWALAKDPAQADRLTQVLFDAAEAIRLAAVLLSPIMPASSREILRRVGAHADVLRLDRDGAWTSEGERVLAQSSAMWPRFDTKTTKEKRVTEHVPGAPPEIQAPQAPVATPPAPADNRISIDDFMKVELRVAKILAAEAVPKSKKLLKLHVDLGTEQRTIVAGIAEAYEPDSLVGRTIVVVANLKPAKLMGIESNGMVLAASSDEGKPILLSVEAEPGFRVR